MKYPKIQERTLKNRVARNYFGLFDCTEIIEKIDFTVRNTKGLVAEYFLWAEAKADVTDVCDMLTQLILTIGKARTFDKITPPPFLGCFDREKIAFIPYHSIQDFFYQNDFNWKVTPSNRNTREFKLVHTLVNAIITETPTCLFNIAKDEKELEYFIRKNFVVGKTDTTKVPIDKNNFIAIYIKWLETVRPTIQIDWDRAKKSGIIDGDFYLADLLSLENKTLKEKLFVLLKSDYYESDRKINDLGLLNASTASFLDDQKAHAEFWAKYERPPLEIYWDYITERRDLLVPQDVRERKGSFFTPQIWVELSQKYIADVLGKDWQDEYYIWDCAAGTGNLLAGLTNKYHIWASTIDKADVDVMHDRIENGANLLKDHVFQFDFLNDNFDKLPEGLQDIISDEEKRKKLIVYINPPYAEHGSTVKNEHKVGVAAKKRIRQQYAEQLGAASRELYAQFLIRIHEEIKGCKIGFFSKLKHIQAGNFRQFRKNFSVGFLKGFLVPADSFDNVKGKFPIAFQIWDTGMERNTRVIRTNVYDKNARRIGKKSTRNLDKFPKISQWIKGFQNGRLNGANNGTDRIGYLNGGRNDFQNQNLVFIVHHQQQIADSAGYYWIYKQNLIHACIYFAVRKVIPADWLNDRDQFLYPNDGWKADREFRNDCLAYTLFHRSNNIQSQHGVNHWIPFTEVEVNARSKFKSNFMTDFIAGKIERKNGDLFSNGRKTKKLTFSSEAKAVFKAGRKLWTYYHSQPKCNVNASLYDIREHFQGRNANGKMNNKSNDETYNALIVDLRSALKILAAKIEPKVYEYGFLKE